MPADATGNEQLVTGTHLLMCGIVGAVRMRESSAWRLTDEVRARMVETLRYRGPDGSGQWISPDQNCWLGHTRLAIIDIAGGHQPMASEDGAVRVVFNGEIYNHLEVRRELESEGHHFASRCDTEVLVHGYEQWGMDGLVKRLRGMFALAIWDQKDERLSLARDRLGIKPLYWCDVDGVLVFASEIKAILAYPGVRRMVDRSALLQYLTFRYVPAPLTMFEGIFKLSAGCWAEVGRQGDKETRRQGEAEGKRKKEKGKRKDEGRDEKRDGSLFSPQATGNWQLTTGNSSQSAMLTIRRYWDVSFARREVDFEEAMEETDRMLRDAVGSHLMSDVPLGAQLSGGVDSSLIVAQMETLRRESGVGEKVRTFSIGFDASEFNELPYARLVAARYGTEHHEVTVGFADFAKEFARLCWVYDEPVSEPAAIPTYLLCRFARQHVTVMLTGEGGDELFAGYPKCAVDQWSKWIDWMPVGLRRMLLRGAAKLLPFSKRRARIALENLSIADEAHRLASWFAGFDPIALVQIARPSLLQGTGAAARILEELNRCDSRHSLDRMLYCDLHTWLVDDLLIKGDRMSMASSVEARVPFLDHSLVEYAASLPPAFKAKGRQTKILLKKLAERYMPHEAIYRAKVGFTVPLTPWFKGPLARFVRGMLLSPRALQRDYFDSAAVESLVNDHLEGRVDRGRALWTLLALEIWHRLFVDDDGTESAAGRLREELSSLVDGSGSV